MDELNALLDSLPNAALVTVAMRQQALDGAVVPDAEGRYPGTPGYVPTYDAYYAALNLLPLLQAQPIVTAASSEGTSISATPPDWAALATFYRSLSAIVASNGNSVLGILPIPGGPHVKRVDMSGRWDTNGDVDTDLN